MPFTAAHPLAVLPLVRWRRPLHLDATSLVIGSMAPDFEYFVRGRLGGGLGHTVLGLGVWCIPVTFVVGVLYHSVVKWPGLLVAPAWLTARAVGVIGGPWQRRWSAGVVVSCIASAVIGGATHLVWDGFTHANGWAVERFPTLQTIVPFPVLGSDPLHRVLQHASSLIGLAILSAVLWRGLRRAAPVVLPLIDGRVCPAVSTAGERCGPIDRGSARRIFVVCVATAVAILVARVAVRRFDAGNFVVAPISGVMAGSIVAGIIVRSSAQRFARALGYVPPSREIAPTSSAGGSISTRP